MAKRLKAETADFQSMVSKKFRTTPIQVHNQAHQGTAAVRHPL